MSIKDEHLIPIVVLDLIKQMELGSKTEKFYTEGRLRAIVNACQVALDKYAKKSTH